MPMGSGFLNLLPEWQWKRGSRCWKLSLQNHEPGFIVKAEPTVVKISSKLISIGVMVLALRKDIPT